MTIVFISLGVFLLVVLAMSVGVLFSNRRIQGSCGGLNNIDPESKECEICGASIDEMRMKGCREALEGADGKKN